MAFHTRQTFVLAMIAAMIASLGGTGVQAAATTSMTMTITPLECNLSVVDDGLQKVGYVENTTCYRALHKDYPNLPLSLRVQ